MSYLNPHTHKLDGQILAERGIPIHAEVGVLPLVGTGSNRPTKGGDAR